MQENLEGAKLKRWEGSTESVQATSQVQLHPGNPTSLQNGAQERGKHNGSTVLSFSEEQELAMGRVEQQAGMDVQRWVSMGSDDLLLIAWLL